MALPLPRSALTQILSRIGEDAGVWAECLFADPIADVAILGPVDNQALPDRWDAYIDWLGGIDGLPIGDAHSDTSKAWVMALDQSWATCSAQCVVRLWTDGVTIDAGMSGSPIVRDGSRRQRRRRRHGRS
jgi:hypothetical protein